jgi:hypothetical protein
MMLPLFPEKGSVDDEVVVVEESLGGGGLSIWFVI